MINVPCQGPWPVKYARKCILYGFPCKMDFSHPSSPNPTRVASDLRLIWWEKSISHGKPYQRHIVWLFVCSVSCRRWLVRPASRQPRETPQVADRRRHCQLTDTVWRSTTRKCSMKTVSVDGETTHHDDKRLKLECRFIRHIIDDDGWTYMLPWRYHLCIAHDDIYRYSGACSMRPPLVRVKIIFKNPCRGIGIKMVLPMLRSSFHTDPTQHTAWTWWPAGPPPVRFRWSCSFSASHSCFDPAIRDHLVYNTTSRKSPNDPFPL